MLSLAELKKVPIYGNAFHDQFLLNNIDTFIISSNTSVEEKIEAIKLINTIMGFEEEVTENDVIAYQKMER